ncbi:MAG: hypothetical protein K2I06_09995 [Ruminococcus sp.]|nr:hypothetical protein [Ruminococcus sp.]
MDKRDERLTALEAAVKSAESKLKNAEIDVLEIQNKLKSNEDSFLQRLADKSEGYKSQTGAELRRNEDMATGRVTYEFVRDTTKKEQKKRQKIIFKRVYDESGKYKLKPHIVLDENDKTMTVTSAKDLKKPKERKKYIAVNMLGIRRIGTDNPFVKAVGTPLTVPISAAVKLQEKMLDSKLGKITAKTGKTIATAAKVAAAPIIIPAKLVKDIYDKGGVIHAVVDLGDRVRIEGVNFPKPLKTAGEAVKSAALGVETGAVETAKGVGSFSIEIAKNKIAEEINKGVSENEAAEAAYVIGMKMIDVYKILDDHSKYKKAVRRDIAGDDIVDTDVSKHLAQKEEKKFQNAQNSLKEKKAAVDFNAENARAEYEAAKKRLESYKKGISETPVKSEDTKPENVSEEEVISKAETAPNEKKSSQKEPVPKGEANPDTLTDKEKTASGTSETVKSPKSENTSKTEGKSKFETVSKSEKTSKNAPVPKGEAKPDTLTKTDKKIEKTKHKLKLNQKHEYKVSFRRVSTVSKDGKAKLALKPVVRREEITGKTPATAWNTAKKLDGYAVSTGIQSMRRKAMRDGGDNSAVEAADFAVTAIQSANRTVKVLDEKERAFREKALKKQLTKLENEKSIETAASKLRENPTKRAVPKEQSKKKTAKKQSTTANQNKMLQKKRQQKLVHSNLAEKSKEAVKDKIKELAAAAVKRSGGIVVIIILGLLVPVMFPVLGLSGSGVSGGLESFIGNAVSPCETNDLSLSDQYYTELAKNLIEQHQNIRNYYTGYDKYTCLTEISKIDHSAQKLLPFLAVSALSISGSDSWDFENAKPFINALFNNLYELYTNEIRETRKHVTQRSETNVDSSRYSLGGSCYNLNGVTYYSEDYAGYAHTNTICEATVASGRDSVTYYNVGKYTDSNGYTHEYENAQDITFDNYWDLKLIYEWNGEEYIEHWRYYTECQDYYEYDYVTLEYAIRESDISVYDSYWTDTDDDWQDNNFDKLIYNQYYDMSDEEKEAFDNYYTFFMGHQVFDMPFDNPQISKYAGYNTDINGDMSLDLSFELKTYNGQEIICGMDGDITVIDRGFSIYNSKYGTIYYDGAASPSVSKAKQGEVISTSTGDVLRITYIDNEGNYVNPLFVFS